MRKRLKNWGWTDVGARRWRHEGLAEAIDLTTEAYNAIRMKQERKLLMHELRGISRCIKKKKFVTSKGRDADVLQEVRYE